MKDEIENQQTLKMKRENPTIEIVLASHGVRSQTASQGSQRRAAALARSFLAQSARKIFISALSPRMRGATPLYFFVVPVTVRLTAPALARKNDFNTRNGVIDRP